MDLNRDFCNSLESCSHIFNQCLFYLRAVGQNNTTFSKHKFFVIFRHSTLKWVQALLLKYVGEQYAYNFKVIGFPEAEQLELLYHVLAFCQYLYFRLIPIIFITSITENFQKPSELSLLARTALRAYFKVHFSLMISSSLVTGTHSL